MRFSVLLKRTSFAAGVALLFGAFVVGAAAGADTPTAGAGWTYNPASPEGKPYFHPLIIPGDPAQTPFTSFRPSDHKWHLGLWFSWKFINGVNFWEPDKRAKIGILNSRHERAGSGSGAGAGTVDTFLTEIAYETALKRGEPSVPVLREQRKVTVTTRAGGDYSIVWDATFRAVADKVVFDRTKPGKNKRTGVWESGGYAGLNLRFADEPAFRYDFANAEGVANAAACGLPSERVTVRIASRDGSARALLTFRDLSAGSTAGGVAPPPAVWFVRHQRGAQKGRGYYVLGSAPLFHKPLVLARGETLHLRYEVSVERLPPTAAGSGVSATRGGR